MVVGSPDSLIKDYKPISLGNLTRLPYPSNLALDTHSYCNASCLVCPIPDLSKKLPMGFMDDALFKRIIDEFSLIARRYPIRGHLLFGSTIEPFIDKNIFDKISYAIDAGLKLIIQTNASILSPDKIDELVRTGFKGPIYISCHGITPKVYKKVMGLDIDKTLHNINYLIGNYPKNLIQIRSIPYQWPIGEVHKVKNYWNRRNIPVKIFLPNSRTSLLSNIISWKLKYPGDKLRGCKKTLPLRDMIVVSNGDAILCCEDMSRKVVLGNLKEHAIVDVWNSDQSKNALEKIFMGKPSDDDFPCKLCEYGVSTRFRKLVRVLDHEVHRLLNCYI